MPDELTLPTYEPLERTLRPGEMGGSHIVILYNCDCHTFDEVIVQLQKATGCTQATAEQIAEEAHQTGRAVAYHGTEEECERVAGFCGLLVCRWRRIRSKGWPE